LYALAVSTAAAIDSSDLARHVRESVRLALAEDVGSGDLTAGLVPADQRIMARVIARESAILCGRAWFDETFRQLDAAISVTWHASDGERVGPDQALCELTGTARPVLTGERTALNFLQLLSGTATATRRYADAVAGTPATILDTRKTIPGLRLAQKYAVRCGGASNHRIGLFDAILVKENHILAAGGIEPAVAAARTRSDRVLLEVEVENLAQAETALRAGVDRLLLDNFDLDRLRAAVTLREELAPGITLEASGGITLENVRAVAETGVDFISVGELTKSARAIDLSMRFHY
jgi:nicotinate-nucleotide pyrophosphorylase (carboxylating)